MHSGSMRFVHGLSATEYEKHITLGRQVNSRAIIFPLADHNRRRSTHAAGPIHKEIVLALLCICARYLETSSDKDEA